MHSFFFNLTFSTKIIQVFKRRIYWLFRIRVLGPVILNSEI
jgi:hypothetical protein